MKSNKIKFGMHLIEESEEENFNLDSNKILYEQENIGEESQEQSLQECSIPKNKPMKILSNRMINP